MAASLRFDGKVVIVTGAGGGLGREYALLFGERGAKVVVNDLGGDMKGDGVGSGRPADNVVNEIKAKGGTAVANYNSVEDGEAVVKTALDTFGRIDIVINNAGILRDRSFARTSDLDWDLIHRVHLRGSFMVTRAAWPHMKDNKFGRIVMTTSTAGIYGNFGQANYSAAKLGVLGLSNTLAIEGRKYNIKCNTIAPAAGTRLLKTSRVASDDMIQALKPEYVAPVVAYLCHDSCEETGALFEVGGGWAAKLRWQRSDGKLVRTKKSVKLTPEQIRDSWDDITDFSNPSYPETTGESSAMVYGLVSEVDSQDGPEPNQTSGGIDPGKAVGAKLAEYTFKYNDRDVILYNLGVGVTTKQEDYLKFLYEHHEDFTVLPSFGVIPALTGMMSGGDMLTALSDVGFPIDPTKILHGEQYLEMKKPFSSSGTLVSRGTIVDVLDKGKGALIIVDTNTYDESGELVCFNQTSTFVQKAGGFGGKRTSSAAKEPINAPNRAPDKTISEKTSIDQAALYRLSGDRNPLHIDPSFAAMGGFSTPILHGLCSFGYAVKHVLKAYADNDVTKFKAVKVRFSSPVLPGQTIQTDMWQDGSRIFFQCKVAETGKVSLSGAYVDLVGVSATAGTSEPQPAATSGLQSDALFSEIATRVKGNPDVAKKVNAMYQFNVTQNGKQVSQWTVDLKGKAEVYKGEPKSGKAGCTITMSDSDLIDMATGKLNGQMAFMKGKLKVKGNIMLAQKLGTIFQDQSKL